MEYLKFMFSGFWVFIGCWIIITSILTFLSSVHNRFWRHWNIRKHGYPPEHCDADGDLPSSYEEVQ